MRRYVFLFGVLASLLVTMASMAYATTSLNSSRSNIYRLTYDSSVVTSTEVTAILDELNTAHPGGNVNEATVGAILRKHLGVKYGSIRKLIIRPATGPGKPMSIVILNNLADEAAAIAVSDPGMPAEKPTRGKTPSRSGTPIGVPSAK